jgi:AP2-like factor (euAP2 lineage)
MPEKQRQKSAARSSKFKGVRWHRVQSKWQAGISVHGKHVYLGLHASEEAAANAVKAAAERRAKDLEVTGVKSRKGHGEAKGSKFRGVRWQRHQSKWYAGIQFKGKHHYLGIFDAEEGAARAYDAKALELKGAGAALNLPGPGQRAIGQPKPSSKSGTQKHESTFSSGALPEQSPMLAVNPIPVEVGGKRTHDDLLSGGTGKRPRTDSASVVLQSV